MYHFFTSLQLSLKGFFCLFVCLFVCLFFCFVFFFKLKCIINNAMNDVCIYLLFSMTLVVSLLKHFTCMGQWPY